MKALELLLKRSSHSKLTLPAPTDDELSTLFQAALRAPDHAGLRPWRFDVYKSPQALQLLGDKLVQASLAEEPELSVEQQTKIRNLPSRAPVVVVAITEYQEHPKVPAIEQAISCGCAVHGMLLAAQAMGYGGYWRTGSLAFNQALKAEFGIKASDEIVGFLYLGTPLVNVEKPSMAAPEQYFNIIE